MCQKREVLGLKLTGFIDRRVSFVDVIPLPIKIIFSALYISTPISSKVERALRFFFVSFAWLSINSYVIDGNITISHSANRGFKYKLKDDRRKTFQILFRCIEFGPENLCKTFDCRYVIYRVSEKKLCKDKVPSFDKNKKFAT